MLAIIYSYKVVCIMFVITEAHLRALSQLSIVGLFSKEVTFDRILSFLPVSLSVEGRVYNLLLCWTGGMWRVSYVSDVCMDIQLHSSYSGDLVMALIDTLRWLQTVS